MNQQLRPNELERDGDDADRLGQEMVHALFDSVIVGVSSAFAGALVLVGALARLDGSAPVAGPTWIFVIGSCALAHVVLQRLHARSPDLCPWRRWLGWFAAIAFAEGVGWGSATFLLAPAGGPFDRELLVLLVTAGIAAGSVAAFAPHLATFMAFFVPATLPFCVASAFGTGDLRHILALLMALFMTAISALGVRTGLTFRRLVALRLQTERLAENLRVQKDSAEAANLAKSSFLAAASHDLRQPVHAIGLLAGALRLADLRPEARRLVEQIEASTEAMDDLFTALLDISRLDAGIVEVHRRAVAVTPLIERICLDHVEEAQKKGLRLVCHPADVSVDSDPVLLERILRNFVSNAVRYTEHGGIVIGCRHRGRLLRIEVWDSGPGIPADQRDRIFQEYTQLGNPERDRTKGLGLGLAIVRRLTALLDCDLTLTSRVGRGSCFAVEVPLTTADVEPQEERAEAPGALASCLIVVVDDERAIRDAMESLLTGWGHRVITAGSGAEAVAMLSDCPERPSLVICDYRLRAHENGIDVVDRLRLEYNEPLPALLITGDTAPDRLVEAEASGLVLLSKPVSNVKLRAALAHLLAAPTAREG